MKWRPSMIFFFWKLEPSHRVQDFYSECHTSCKKVVINFKLDLSCIKLHYILQTSSCKSCTYKHPALSLCSSYKYKRSAYNERFVIIEWSLTFRKMPILMVAFKYWRNPCVKDHTENGTCSSIVNAKDCKNARLIDYLHICIFVYEWILFLYFWFTPYFVKFVIRFV